MGQVGSGQVWSDTCTIYTSKSLRLHLIAFADNLVIVVLTKTPKELKVRFINLVLMLEFPLQLLFPLTLLLELKIVIYNSVATFPLIVNLMFKFCRI